MTMVESQPNTQNGSEHRLVTVADLRHELDRERQITNSNFESVVIRIEALDRRIDDFKSSTAQQFAQIDSRFAQVDSRFDQVDKRFALVDSRFDQVDKQFAQIDSRFDQVDKRLDQVDRRLDRIDRRFDLLDERLRFNKTLIVASLSAVASVTSVVLTLLK